MAPLTRLQKFLLWTLFGVLVVVGLSALLAHAHSVNDWGTHVMLFDQDMSDSILGWLIAIPAVMLATVIVIVALAGTGIILAGVFAMVLVIAILALVVAIAFTVLPLAAFFAVPILFVWMIVRFAKRKDARTAQMA
jgi:hypothetical protein